MEKKKFILPAAILISIFVVGLFVGTQVLAQIQDETDTNDPTLEVLEIDSPFGSLADEDNTYREVLNYEGQTLDKYKELKEEYEELQDIYDIAYGPRKEELREKIEAKTKDILVTKLGALDTYLKSMIDGLDDLNVVDEDKMNALRTVSSEFADFAKQTQDSINNVESEDELEALIPVVNNRISSSYDLTLYYLTLLSIHRGEYLKDQLVLKASLVQKHIDASGALGGDVEPVQKDFDYAMLDLEDSKNEYIQQKQELLATQPTNTREVLNVLRDVTGTSKTVSESQEKLVDVIFDLKILYGQSPWDIDN